MTSRTIPPVLQPHLTVPAPSSLTLLSSVLGASTNWLLARHIHVILSSNNNLPPTSPPTGVILVSFLRDLSFWTTTLSRLGTDLPAAGERGAFGFVDGLGCGLLLPPPQSQQAQAQAQAQAPLAAGGATAGRQIGWRGTLCSAAPHDVKRMVEAGVERMMRRSSGAGEEERRVVVVLDGLDFVVAAAGGGYGLTDKTVAEEMRDVVMDLRDVSFFFSSSFGVFDHQPYGTYTCHE